MQGPIPAEKIKELLEAQIEQCQCQAEVDGSHLNLVVVSPAFEGLSAVKKQQLVYGVLQEYITNGAIHAVNMKTLTPSQV